MEKFENPGNLPTPVVRSRHQNPEMEITVGFWQDVTRYGLTQPKYRHVTVLCETNEEAMSCAKWHYASTGDRFAVSSIKKHEPFKDEESDGYNSDL